jgi:pSer/pThr/pTyr-binding forkhead associated (FHA) protein
VFLRPDGRPGVRFPILKKTPTVLGRGGMGRDDREVLVDVPLPDDPKVSLQHARIVWDGPEHDRPAIEDMNSKSGTWVEVADRSLVADGDVFWLGELYMKVVAAN